MKTILIALLLTSLIASRPDTAPAPPVPVPCQMQNGQQRKFPCEFKIQTLFFLGKNNELVGKVTPTSTSVKLPKSKAIKTIHSASGDSYVYNVSLDFSRINTPSFSPKPNGPTLVSGFYEVGISTIDDPISPGEISVIKKINVSPDLPKPGIRPNRIEFELPFNYSTGSGSTIIAPVQYLQIKNPITFTKLPDSVNRYRDRSESWIAFYVGVDLTK